MQYHFQRRVNPFRKHGFQRNNIEWTSAINPNEHIIDIQWFPNSCLNGKRHEHPMGTLGVLGLEMIRWTRLLLLLIFKYIRKTLQANVQFCARAKGSSQNLTHIGAASYGPLWSSGCCQSPEDGVWKGLSCARLHPDGALWFIGGGIRLHLIQDDRENSPIPISLSVFPVSNDVLEVIRSLNGKWDRYSPWRLHAGVIQ